MFVADFGTISVRSQLHEEQNTQALSVEELQQLMYDLYAIKLTGIKVRPHLITINAHRRYVCVCVCACVFRQPDHASAFNR